jgi:hypothetical protein
VNSQNRGRGRPSPEFSIAVPKIAAAIVGRNTVKILEACEHVNSFRFGAVIGATRDEVLVFLCATIGPIDHYPINLFPLS